MPDAAGRTGAGRRGDRLVALDQQLHGGVPAEATIDLDYVTIVGEGFAADTFCGVDALYNETGATPFCNELIERFYSAVYGVTVFTNSGDITAASPSGYWFEVTYTPQPGDIAYASAEARERYGNHYAIVKSVDDAGGTVTLFEQNWVWDGKAGVNRRIPYDGGCYTFYTMCSSAGRAAPAGEAEPVAAAPAAEEPQPVSDDVSTIYAWGSGISSITGTPSSWAAELVSHADVYGITMLLEYLMSTLYHAIAADKAKRVFKVLDHSFIYLFIAGSYTPFCLVTLAHSGGYVLGVIVWALAVAGVACEAFWVFRPRWISVVLYLALGWCVVWFLPPLAAALPTPGLILLAAGGLCYSIGCIFYVLKKVRYMHSLFHVWVLAGSVCQFLAIVLYVV